MWSSRVVGTPKYAPDLWFVAQCKVWHNRWLIDFGHDFSYRMPVLFSWLMTLNDRDLIFWYQNTMHCQFYTDLLNWCFMLYAKLIVLKYFRRFACLEPWWTIGWDRMGEAFHCGSWLTAAVRTKTSLIICLQISDAICSSQDLPLIYNWWTRYCWIQHTWMPGRYENKGGLPRAEQEIKPGLPK